MHMDFFKHVRRCHLSPSTPTISGSILFNYIAYMLSTAYAQIAYAQIAYAQR